jgi:hypothetical protein
MALLKREKLQTIKVIDDNGNERLVKGYRQKTVLDNIIILLGVLFAVLMFYILFDVLNELTIFGPPRLDLIEALYTDPLILNFGTGFVVMLMTGLVLILWLIMLSLIGYYVYDLVELIRTFFKGATDTFTEVTDTVKDAVGLEKDFSLFKNENNKIAAAISRTAKKIKRPGRPIGSPNKKAVKEASVLDTIDLDAALTSPDFKLPETEATVTSQETKKPLF